MTEASPNSGSQQFRPLREAAWLQEHGHKVVVLCGKSRRLAAELDRNEPHPDIEKVDSWRNPRALLRLASVFTHGADSTGRSVIGTRRMTVPEPVSVGGTIGYRFDCRRIVASAHFIRKELVVRFGLSDTRTDVVGEGANLEELHPGLDGRGFRAEFGIPPNSPLFGTTTVMRPEKG